MGASTIFDGDKDTTVQAAVISNNLGLETIHGTCEVIKPGDPLYERKLNKLNKVLILDLIDYLRNILEQREKNMDKIIQQMMTNNTDVKFSKSRAVAANSKEMTEVTEENPLLYDSQPENPTNEHVGTITADVSHRNTGRLSGFSDSCLTLKHFPSDDTVEISTQQMEKDQEVLYLYNPRAEATNKMADVNDEIITFLNDSHPEKNPTPERGSPKPAEDPYKNPSWQSKFDKISHLWQKMGWSERIRTTMLVLGGLMCSVTVITTAVGVAKLANRNGELPAGLSEKQQLSQDICVECSKLVAGPKVSVEPDPLLNKLTTRRVDNGRQMCCARDVGQMSAMVEAIVKKRETSKSPRPQGLGSHPRFTPISAHKQLVPPEEDLYLNQTGPQDPEVFIHYPVKARFLPDLDEPQTGHTRGVRVLNSSIQILHDGLYYVYFSVLIRVRSDKPSSSFAVPFWVHYVLRCRPGEENPRSLLLRIAHTTNNDIIRDQESSFAGGTFYLDKDDLIEASVFARGLIDYQRESTYLGLFMLESGHRK